MPWHSLLSGVDEVELDDWFALRVPTLRSCPHFLRGRLRHCFAIALREQRRAKIEGDEAAEVRAWKLFGLVPMMLLHRPKPTGSIGRDELAIRAEDIAKGHWIQFARWPLKLRAGEMTTKRRNEFAGESKPKSVVQQGQVSRARQALVGAALAPKNEATLTEWQRCRPQETLSEIPLEVLNFQPNAPLELDRKIWKRFRPWRLHQ